MQVPAPLSPQLLPSATASQPLLGSLQTWQSPQLGGHVAGPAPHACVLPGPGPGHLFMARGRPEARGSTQANSYSSAQGCIHIQCLRTSVKCQACIPRKCQKGLSNTADCVFKQLCSHRAKAVDAPPRAHATGVAVGNIHTALSTVGALSALRAHSRAGHARGRAAPATILPVRHTNARQTPGIPSAPLPVWHRDTPLVGGVAHQAVAWALLGALQQAVCRPSQ